MRKNGGIPSFLERYIRYTNFKRLLSESDCVILTMCKKYKSRI